MKASLQLQIFYGKHRDKIWPFSRKSAPSWAALLSALTGIFVRYILWRKRTNLTKAHAKKCERILWSMDVTLAAMDKKDKPPDKGTPPDDKSSTAGAEGSFKRQTSGGGIEEGLPDPRKVFGLLWDGVQNVSTTKYGVDPLDERTQRIKILLKRVVANELKKAIYMTRRARKIPLQLQDAKEEVLSLKEDKECQPYRQGDRLEATLRFAAEQVRYNLGKDFVEAETLKSGWSLLREVRQDQKKNVGLLLRQLVPVIPPTLMTLVCKSLAGMFRATFYTLATWNAPLDSALSGNMRQAYWQLARVFIAHVVIDYFGLLSRVFQTRARQLMNLSVKGSVMKALMKQDYEFYDRHSPGELQDRLNNDTGRIQALIELPTSMIAQWLEIFCNLYNAYIMAPGNVFWPSVIPLFPTALAQQLLSRWSSRISAIQNRVREQHSGKTFEVLREIKTIRQFAMEQRAAKEFTQQVEIQDDLSLYAQVRASFADILFTMSIYGGLIITDLMGANQVQTGQMKQVDLLSVMFQLNFNCVFPTRDLLGRFPELYQLRDPILRISELLDATPVIEPQEEMPMLKYNNETELHGLMQSLETIRDGAYQDRRVVVREAVSQKLVESDVAVGGQLVSLKEAGGVEISIHDKEQVCLDKLRYPVEARFSDKIIPERFHGKIELDQVHFSYPTNPQMQVLKGVSLTVEPGQKVALVGATGCGKSSIMQLLLRLYQPQKGQIRIDGRPIEDYDVRHLRSRMVIVDQNTVLFAMTIRENVTFGMKDDVNEEEVQRSCTEACAWDFIQEKPDKLMTDILTGGSNLSGGQKQRLAIARAMIRNPDIILLDEATSALDVKNEKVVQEALDKLAKQGSALVIAHRLSTVQDSDKLIVINSGVNSEQGTHEELLKESIEDEEQPSQGVSCAGEARVLSRSQSEGTLAKKHPLTRTNSSPQLLSSQGSQKRKGLSNTVTYKDMWDATNKKKVESLSLKQIQEKMKNLQEELSALEARSTVIKDHISKLQPTNGSTEELPEEAPAGFCLMPDSK